MLRELHETITYWVHLIPRAVRWGAAAVLAAIVAVALVRGTGGAAGVEPATPGRDEVQGAVMLRRDGAAVLGTLQTTDGAAAAAISYAQQRNALLTGGTSSAIAAEVGGKLAVGGHDIGRDPASIPDRAGAVNTTGMLETRAGQMSWWTIPFGYRVRSYTAGRALVRVFFGLLSVGALASDGPGAISLSLQDFDLRWRGAWRLWGVRSAPDQPTAVGTLGVSTRRDVVNRPFPDRVVKTSEQDGVPLFTFLSGAAALTGGPAGMGPIAARTRLDDDATAIVKFLAGATRAAISRDRMQNGGHGAVWLSTVPVAYRRGACPDGTDGRCYFFLLVGAGTEGGPALVTFNVGGLVLAGSGSGISARQLDVPPAVEDGVLGGLVKVAGEVRDGTRTSSTAWRRSVRPLRPTEIAGWR